MFTVWYLKVYEWILHTSTNNCSFNIAEEIKAWPFKYGFNPSYGSFNEPLCNNFPWVTFNNT